MLYYRLLLQQNSLYINSVLRLKHPAIQYLQDSVLNAAIIHPLKVSDFENNGHKPVSIAASVSVRVCCG